MRFKKSQDFTFEERELIETAKGRFAKLPKPEILDWCDQAGSGLARALDDYRRLGGPESVQEAKMGALAVLAAVWVLEDRAS